MYLIDDGWKIRIQIHDLQIDILALFQNYKSPFNSL